MAKEQEANKKDDEAQKWAEKKQKAREAWNPARSAMNEDQEEDIDQEIDDQWDKSVDEAQADTVESDVSQMNFHHEPTPRAKIVPAPEHHIFGNLRDRLFPKKDKESEVDKQERPKDYDDTEKSTQEILRDKQDPDALKKATVGKDHDLGKLEDGYRKMVPDPSEEVSLPNMPHTQEILKHKHEPLPKNPFMRRDVVDNKKAVPLSRDQSGFEGDLKQPDFDGMPDPRNVIPTQVSRKDGDKVIPRQVIPKQVSRKAVAVASQNPSKKGPQITVDGHNIKLEPGTSVTVDSNGDIAFHTMRLDSYSIKGSQRPMDHTIENAGIDLKAKKQAMDFDRFGANKNAFDRSYGQLARPDDNFNKGLGQFLENSYKQKGPAFNSTLAQISRKDPYAAQASDKNLKKSADKSDLTAGPEMM